jgi:hypothetical protein
MANLPAGDPRHGTLHAYNNLDCRCLACTVESQRYRLRGIPEDSSLHGEPRGYNRGCRCDSCRAAMRARAQAYRAQRRAARAGQ